ncbi:MAG: HAD family hydrolase, partial [Magnetococcales bacterium]|nr:HAD family hydrolase [Magnetococcales bacterium]
MTFDYRTRLLSCLEQNLTHETTSAAKDFLNLGTDAGRWRFVSRLTQQLPEGGLGLKPIRVALLASFSIEFIQDALTALGMAHGLRILIYQAGFAQYHQEIIQPDSPLYAFKPDVVILAMEGERVIPAIYTDDLTLAPTDQEHWVSEAMACITPLITAFRRHSDALLLIHNFDPPTHRVQGILDGLATPGQAEMIHAVNAALLALSRTQKGVYVVEYAGLVARVGAENWYDLRMAHLAKAPIAQKMMPRLAKEYLKYLRAVSGLARKCLVLDLDNTLWGGILGEEGLAGLKLGAYYPGSAFVAFQRAVLHLHNRGVLLAIASKNNPEDVAEVFQHHPAMILKSHHFACQEIHWNPKSQSLQNIARRLNIGLEQMVFMDDNPAECSQINIALPMVTVIPFPSRPEEAVDTLSQDGWFDSLTLSAEDKKRNTLYQQRAKAEELQASSDSLTEYYTNLAMRVTIRPLTQATLPRTAQLTQKTNQFNLTTFRYTEEEIDRRLSNPNWLLLTVQVSDCFGDNGLVGVVMAECLGQESILLIDTFLLSCRVIGRTIETAMLAHLCIWARESGLRLIRGRVRPTAKNGPAQSMFRNHGFQLCSSPPIDAATPEESVWELDLTQGEVTIP